MFSFLSSSLVFHAFHFLFTKTLVFFIFFVFLCFHFFICSFFHVRHFLAFFKFIIFYIFSCVTFSQVFHFSGLRVITVQVTVPVTAMVEV